MITLLPPLKPLKPRIITMMALASMLAFLSVGAYADASTSASASDTTIQIKQPWVRSTVPGQKVTGVFMQLIAEKNSKLVSVSSPEAGRAEIHQMTMDDHHVMKMRAMKGLDLPAGKTVELKPGSYHIMLLDVKKQLKKEDEISLTLKFVKKEDKESKEKSKKMYATNITIKVPVLDSL